MCRYAPQHILDAPVRQLVLLLGLDVEEAPLDAADHPELRVRRALAHHDTPLGDAGVAHHRVGAHDGAALLSLGLLDQRALPDLHITRAPHRHARVGNIATTRMAHAGKTKTQHHNPPPVQASAEPPTVYSWLRK